MLILRDATPADCEALARFHARSWQSAYRGILDDAFLDCRALANRMSRWRERMVPSLPYGLLVRLACDAAGLQGFICVQLDADEQWGALIDNLHVDPLSKGAGIGRKLLASAAAWIRHRRTESPVHLWAFEANLPARGFYQHLGGHEAERIVRPGPDGSDLPEIRYVWPNAAILESAAARK